MPCLRFYRIALLWFAIPESHSNISVQDTLLSFPIFCEIGVDWWWDSGSLWCSGSACICWAFLFVKREILKS